MPSRELYATISERLHDIRKGGICDDHRQADNDEIAACEASRLANERVGGCDETLGIKKQLRKRFPKDNEITLVSQLNGDDRYRTPLSDLGHRWEVGSIFFVCGRYVEYPEYYREGWDHMYGPHKVWLDTRSAQSNECKVCKGLLDKRNKDVPDLDRMVSVANKKGVTMKFPETKTTEIVPHAIERWARGRRVERLYVHG